MAHAIHPSTPLRVTMAALHSVKRLYAIAYSLFNYIVEALFFNQLEVLGKCPAPSIAVTRRRPEAILLKSCFVYLIVQVGLYCLSNDIVFCHLSCI